MTALRLPIALVLATVVAAGLFGFLRALIGARGELEQVQAPGKIEFSRLRRDTEVEERKREKPEKAKPQQAPPPPELSASRASLDPTADAQAIAAIAPTVAAEQALVGGLVGGGGGDRDAVPLVRIEPDYPMQARQRGIEGWVVVQFTISTAGTVKDAVVLASEPGTVFDRAALQAVRKWKYNPKMQNGKPVERAGIKVRLDFEMET